MDAKQPLTAKDKFGIGVLTFIVVSIGLATFAPNVLLFILGQGPREPDPVTTAAPSPPATTESPPAVSTPPPLDYPGDAELFERGVNILIPWTAEIDRTILVMSAQDVCAALDRSGDPNAARQLAIEFGFSGSDTAPFIEQSTSFFCAEFKGLVPQMSNP